MAQRLKELVLAEDLVKVPRTQMGFTTICTYMQAKHSYT